MGGAKNLFFLLCIPKNHKKVNAICKGANGNAGAGGDGMRLKYKILKIQKLFGANATYIQW